MQHKNSIAVTQIGGREKVEGIWYNLMECSNMTPKNEKGAHLTSFGVS